MTRLHLGCGERYLEGYVNIDFPKSQHSIQEKDLADLHMDILKLSYPPGTIEEIRLHHVFEHFARPVACALIASWNSWLMDDGIIHIEVPDLKKMSAIILNPFSSIKAVSVAERHIFGSHEADWAVHYDGYNKKMLSLLLTSFGFRIIACNKNSWKGTHNIEIKAKKEISVPRSNFENIAEKYLMNFIIDNSEIEKNLLKIWLNKFEKQIEISYSQ
jgi:hypothetical protein